jgi:hypothetical protein
MMNLIKYEAARQALVEAHSVDEVKGIRDKAEALRIYAQQAKDTQLEYYAAEIRVRAERRAGELLRDTEKHPAGRPSKSVERDDQLPPTLTEMNITKDQSSQWQRLASVPEETFEKKIAEAKDSDEPLSLRRILSKKEVIPFSGEYEWYTPEIYLEMAREVMGSIDTDPASSKIANKSVKAETFYTQSQNGLTKDWIGNVFLNPPYCMPEIEQFLNKLLAEYAKGNVKQAIVLTNNSTDTNWWQGLAGATGICFPSHRIQFIAEDGKTKSSPLRGQTFFHLGKSHDTFYKVFGDIGIVF